MDKCFRAIRPFLFLNGVHKYKTSVGPMLSYRFYVVPFSVLYRLILTKDLLLNLPEQDVNLTVAI
jgi:hypothetical protein